uniref:(northern house mosquito) hypothetical protein n=1 Tax=Culex pipiens TaxID=7175 RepID=A0A8D8GJX7_CULPI
MFQTTRTASGSPRRSTARCWSRSTRATSTTAASSPRICANPSARWTRWKHCASRPNSSGKSRRAGANAAPTVKTATAASRTSRSVSSIPLPVGDSKVAVRSASEASAAAEFRPATAELHTHIAKHS